MQNRSQYALFLTVLLALVVMTVSSVLVLQFESRSPDANIKTGGDALWWALVTITTVGYGDFFPVTTLGRLTGAFVMLSGVGIIGALASILASLLLAPTSEDDEKAADAGRCEDCSGHGGSGRTGRDARRADANARGARPDTWRHGRHQGAARSARAVCA